MRTLTIVVALLFSVSVMLPAVGQSTGPADTVLIVKDTTTPSNAQVAVIVAQETFDTAGRVLVARDDAFADALASGVLQRDAPLLLVPSSGPIPAEVAAQVDDLRASEAVVLGGDLAVSPGVADELQAMGLSVSRRQGTSRFETAIDIAATDAPAADTVLLARAFGANPDDPSQGFADSIAAGGIAAREGYPVLLTQTDVLADPTREYLLATPPIRRVLILGGTAAISQAVEEEVRTLGYEVQRIAGPSRADTAVEIAKISGDDTAADASRVVVTDGTGENAWAAGFALASHAARFDAPIVLTTGDIIPTATEAFLAPGIGGDPDQAPVLTCAAGRGLCETVRRAAQLPPMPVPMLESVGPVPFSVGIGQPQSVAFLGIAGQQVAIGYDNLATTGPLPACVQLELFDPAGDRLQNLSSSISNCTDERPRDGRGDPVALPVDGEYQLRVTAADGPLTGNAFVTGVAFTSVEMGGAPVSVSVDRPGEIHRATFSGVAGQQVAIGYDNLATTEFVPACLQAELLAPTGDRVLATLDSGISHCTDQNIRDGEEDPVILPETGEFAVEVSFRTGASGSVDLYVTEVQTAPIVVGGAPLSVSVDRPGEIHRATFSGTAGQQVTIGYDNLATTEFVPACVQVELYTPTGNRVLASLVSGFTHCTDQNTSAVTDPVTLPETGEFFMEVNFRSGASGSLTISVR